MYKQTGIRFIIIQLMLLCSLLPVNASDLQSLLKKADAYRLESDAMQVESEVTLYKAGVRDKERRYTVYLRPGRRSLVLMRSPMEKGQKVLMLGDEFWQIMPQSQRPFRITPMQKLLGDASVGDIATMSWSDDYTGQIAGEEPVEGINCLHLSLQARTRGVSYQRIELYLTRHDARPVLANLYTASDKLAKQARFSFEQHGERILVNTMTITDMIQTGRQTVIRYLARKPRRIPDEWLNPMFLVRNDLGE